MADEVLVPLVAMVPLMKTVPLMVIELVSMSKPVTSGAKLIKLVTMASLVGTLFSSKIHSAMLMTEPGLNSITSRRTKPGYAARKRGVSTDTIISLRVIKAADSELSRSNVKVS